jgi:hypothetical protein
MTPLQEWAARWNIPQAAIDDFRRWTLNLDGGPGDSVEGVSEAAVQAQCRVAASRKGMRLWRNNVGAFQDPQTGAWVRFGLANDSRALNQVIKSGDLIGIHPRIVQPQDVGCLIGQFVSYEVKAGGWQYRGTEREVAQEAWATLITSLGGVARFVTSPLHV